MTIESKENLGPNNPAQGVSIVSGIEPVDMKKVGKLHAPDATINEVVNAELDRLNRTAESKLYQQQESALGVISSLATKK